MFLAASLLVFDFISSTVKDHHVLCWAAHIVVGLHLEAEFYWGRDMFNTTCFKHENYTWCCKMSIQERTGSQHRLRGQKLPGNPFTILTEHLLSSRHHCMCCREQTQKTKALPSRSSSSGEGMQLMQRCKKIHRLYMLIKPKIKSTTGQDKRGRCWYRGVSCGAEWEILLTQVAINVWTESLGSVRANHAAIWRKSMTARGKNMIINAWRKEHAWVWAG